MQIINSWPVSKPRPLSFEFYNIVILRHVNRNLTNLRVNNVIFFMVNGGDNADKHLYPSKLYLEYIDGKYLLSFRRQLSYVQLHPQLEHY